MELTINYINKQHQNVQEIVNSFPSVSVFWKSIASFIAKSIIPGRITATSQDNGTAAIAIKKQDYKKDSIYTEIADNTYGLAPSPFSERYLIHGEKAYVLVPVKKQDGSITSFSAVYGRSEDVLSGKGKKLKATYPIAEFWVRYYEKLAKGYKDRSRLVSLSPKTTEDNDTGKELFQSLYEETLKALPLHTLSERKRNLNKIILSETQIAKAWKCLRQLKKAKRFKTFAATYQALISFLPSTSDLQDTITPADMENKDKLFNTIHNVLSNMENIVACKSTFADRGVTILPASDEDTKRIMDMLPQDIADRVETVYAVKNPVKEANFKKYCERLKITVTKELWHGSRNENWISIIKNGLQIHPNAQITGKMFGDGIYFATEAKKSYGYTSCQGTYWAGGGSKYGFMGLFTTAYGNPCYDSHNYRYSYNGSDYQRKLTRKGYHCLHALASNTSLYHDEIVFYHESGVLLSYIIKIKS